MFDDCGVLSTALTDAQLKQLGLKRTSRLDPKILTNERREYIRGRLGYEAFKIQSNLATHMKDDDAFKKYLGGK